MPIRDTFAAAYRYNWPHLSHYLNPVWVITVTPFGSYSIVQIEITVAYSASTLRYIQSFPISTSLENAGMKHVKRDKEIWINET